MSDAKTMFRSACSFLSGTMISKVSGFARDLVMAYYFGTSSHLAGFLVAYRMVYLFRRLWGESTLNQGFIPQFEEERSVSGKRGVLLFRDVLQTLTLVIVGIYCVIGASLWIYRSEETLWFGFWMLPGIVCLSLFGFVGGYLQTQGKFFLISSASFWANLVWILGMICFHHFPNKQALTLLSGCISCGFFVQLLSLARPVYLSVIKEVNIREFFSFSPNFGLLKKVFKPASLALFATASVQINSFVDTLFAKTVSPEGPAFLWYAGRLMQLPLSLIAVSFATALLPALAKAKQFQEKDRADLIALEGMTKSAVWMIPCVIACFVFGTEGVSLLFEYGAFTKASASHTTLCLQGYAVGLLPAALVQTLAPVYYTQGAYRFAAFGSFVSTLLNVALNAFFVWVCHLGVVSIAIATSLASMCNLILFHRKLRSQSFWKEVSKSLVAALFAAIITMSCRSFIASVYASVYIGILERYLSFATQGLVYLLIFFLGAKVSKMKLWSVGSHLHH